MSLLKTQSYDACRANLVQGPRVVSYTPHMYTSGNKPVDEDLQVKCASESVSEGSRV